MLSLPETGSEAQPRPAVGPSPGDPLNPQIEPSGGTQPAPISADASATLLTQPAPTNTDASATPLIQIRAPQQPCHAWKVFKALDHIDEGLDEEARALAKKKELAKKKALSRKRKREAMEANRPHVPEPPGQKHTFYDTPVKYEFLKAARMATQGMNDGAYQAITNSFIAKFGRHLPLKQDPDPTIDYAPYSVNDYPEHEREGERNRRKEFDRHLTLFLSTWYRNHFNAKSEEKALVNSLLKSMVESPPPTSRMKDPAIEWGNRNWDTLLKEGYYAENPESTSSDPNFLANVRTFKQRTYNCLPEPVRIDWVKQLKEEHIERKARVGEPKMEERHARANELWEKRMQVLPSFAEALVNGFGMGCVVFLYGPVGADNGKMDVTSCESCCPIPLTTADNQQYIPASKLYVDMDPVGFQEIQQRLMHFAEQRFPPEFGEARYAAHGAQRAGMLSTSATSTPAASESTTSATSSTSATSTPTASESTTASVPTASTTTASVPTASTTTASVPTASTTTASVPTASTTTASVPTASTTTASVPTASTTTASLPMASTTTPAGSADTGAAVPTTASVLTAGSTTEALTAAALTTAVSTAAAPTFASAALIDTSAFASTTVTPTSIFPVNEHSPAQTGSMGLAAQAPITPDKVSEQDLIQLWNKPLDIPSVPTCSYDNTIYHYEGFNGWETSQDNQVLFDQHSTPSPAAVSGALQLPSSQCSSTFTGPSQLPCSPIDLLNASQFACHSPSQSTLVGMGQYSVSQSGMGQYPVSHPGMGQYPMLQSSIGQFPGMGQYAVSHPGMGQFPVSHSGMGQYAVSHPGMGQFPVSHSGMGQFPVSQSGMGQFPVSQSGMGQFPVLQSGRGQFPVSQSGMGQFSMSQSGMGVSQSDMGVSQSDMGVSQSGMGQFSMSQSGLGQFPVSQSSMGQSPVSTLGTELPQPPPPYQTSQGGPAFASNPALDGNITRLEDFAASLPTEETMSVASTEEVTISGDANDVGSKRKRTQTEKALAAASDRGSRGGRGLRRGQGSRGGRGGSKTQENV